MTRDGLPLLSVRNLVVQYRATGEHRKFLTAVNDISFDIHAGSTFGLVGESGSGKSSIAHAIVQLVQPTAGEVLFHGENLAGMKAYGVREAQKNIQLVFQDPQASLSPRRSVLQTLLEPLDHFAIDAAGQRRARACSALETVGLDPDLILRFPHELSGGQRQRVALARALVTEPELIIADEAVSSLDVSVQARIIELILDLQNRLGIAFLFISHDLAVVQQLADTVGVMYLGKMVETATANSLFRQAAHQMVETATANSLFRQAAHPYTRSLLDAVPVPDPAHSKPVILEGELPSALTPPAGCVFHTRCPQAMEQCRTVEPADRQFNESVEKGANHTVRCHLWNS
jgi:oligopeptide/dipeptide ABC transporter ATP-binding protein